MLELVPRFLLERLAEGRPRGSVTGAAVYVDIVGFTALGDAMSGLGPVGAETVAAAVQSRMVPIVTAIHRHGGFVVAFPGDAVLAVFPAGEGGDPRRRAVAAAEAMQAAITELGPRPTPNGSADLSARVGVGAGAITWTVLPSDRGHRRTYAFAGSALAAAVAAERACRPGGVVIDSAAELPRRAAAAAADHDRQSSPQRAESTEPVDPRVLEAWARPFVDEPLVPDLGAAEFRPVTTAFVGVPEADLGRVVADVLDLRGRYGGLLDPVEVGDKGCVVRLVWGAPVRHEGDDARCLRFGHALRRRHPELRIGMTTGTAFTGFVGTPQRMGYITYGSHVNLAARLMSAAAPGQILLAGRLAELADRSYAVQDAGVHRFKGLSRPVAVTALADPRSAVAGAGAYVGRVAELAALEDLVRHGSGVGLVHGPPGIGKSSLIAEVRHRAPEVRWVATVADPVWREPLQPLRDVVSALLAPADVHPLDRRGLVERLDALGLGDHPAHPGAIADLLWPDAAVAPEEAGQRRRGVQDAVIALFRAVCARQRLVVQIDDLHWSDEETVAQLPELVTALADLPFVLLATSRESQGLPGLAPALDLALGELDAAGLAGLGRELLGAELSARTVDWLAHRTDGNPFFAQQVLLHLRERGQLAVTPDGLTVAADTNDVPPSVGAVVVARLDGLPGELRAVVKSASVLGPRVDLEELSGLLARESGPARRIDLVAATDRGVERGVWRRSGSSVEFAHALVRDAAYETMVVAVRRRLNGLAAAVIEERHAAALGPHLHRLARHHVEAGDWARARARERQAADRALSLGAHHEAGAYAIAGLSVGEVGPEVPAGQEILDPAQAAGPEELGLWLALAASRMVTDGQGASTTKQAYDRAAALAGAASESPEGFRALYGLRTFFLFRGDHRTSLEMARRSLAVAVRLGAPDLLEQARLMVGNACFWVGELDEAERQLQPVLSHPATGQRAAHRAAFAQDPRITALFPAALGRWLTGDRSDALRQAQTALTDDLDDFGRVTVLQVIGFLHCLDRDVESAHRTATRLVDLATDKQFPVYGDLGIVQLGWAEAYRSTTEDDRRSAIAVMINARERLAGAGTVVGSTLTAALLADACRRAGRIEEGIRAADLGLADAAARGELAFAGLLRGIRTELLASQPARTDVHPRERAGR